MENNETDDQPAVTALDPLERCINEILAAGERASAIGALKEGMREITELVHERPGLAGPAHGVLAALAEQLVEHVREGMGGRVKGTLARALAEIRAGVRPPTNVYRGETPKPALREGANYFPDKIVVVKDGKVVKTVQQGIF